MSQQMAGNLSVMNATSGEHKKTTIKDFPMAEQLTFNNWREFYTKMQAKYKEIGQEKEEIMVALRQEILNNEELKRYIGILRQTIESTILRNGLGPLLGKEKYKFNQISRRYGRSERRRFRD